MRIDFPRVNKRLRNKAGMRTPYAQPPSVYCLLAFDWRALTHSTGGRLLRSVSRSLSPASRTHTLLAHTLHRTRVRTLRSKMRLSTPEVRSISPPLETTAPPPPLPGAHVCGTPIARNARSFVRDRRKNGFGFALLRRGGRSYAAGESVLPRALLQVAEDNVL